MSVVRFDDCSCDRETEKACKVFISDLDEMKWIPKSVIHDDSEVYKDGTIGELVLQEWWATKENLT